jgi:cytoskeleton protein RodZ
MGKTESDASNIGQADAAENEAASAAQQPQLTFFDTVTPPTMTTENSPAEHVQNEAGLPADAADAHADRPDDAVEDHGALDAVADAQSAPAHPAHVGESLGQRLRATREARGLRIEEAAQRMKLPFGTVQALEADRYERIGEGIYLRSYLTKYLRLLDLPLVLAERVLTQHEEPPPLFTSGTISRPRYLFERYSSSALYLILTAVIIVPAVWLAMRAGFEPGAVQITPLDGPQSASTSVAQTQQTHAAPDANGNVNAASSQHNDEAPLVASLAPFPAMKHDADVAEKSVAESSTATPTSAIRAGEHVLRLALPEASWVEIVAADGEKLEYGLLPAGTVRSYHSAKAIDVRLGNSSGATVEIDGKPADLTPYRHSNVAHFRMSGGEASASHSGG